MECRDIFGFLIGGCLGFVLAVWVIYGYRVYTNNERHLDTMIDFMPGRLAAATV